MGHVTTKVKVENMFDLAAHRKGKNGRRGPRARTVVIPDALVDTGATHLCLPGRYIRQLGLPLRRRVRLRTATGAASFKMYSGALLTIQGRDQECEVVELPGNAPALVGVIPLEGLDLTVDPLARRVVGKHGRRRFALLYRAKG